MAKKPKSRPKLTPPKPPGRPIETPKPPAKSKLDILITELSAKHEADPAYASPVGLSNILLLKQIKLLEEIKGLLCHTKAGQT